MPPTHWSMAQAAGALPIRNIYAIGWNYPLHNEELNRRRDVPLIVFMKSSGSVLGEGQEVRIPAWTKEFHYEGELVALIGKGGYRISEDDALDHVWGYAPGLDFTLRDLQREEKAAGQPWWKCKNFAGATAAGEFIAKENVPRSVDDLRLSLRLNGETRQNSLIGAMNYRLPQLVALISANLPLLPGDAIFTGTPEGVGSCASGDEVVVTVEEVGSLTVRVA